MALDQLRRDIEQGSLECVVVGDDGSDEDVGAPGRVRQPLAHEPAGTRFRRTDANPPGPGGIEHQGREVDVALAVDVLAAALAQQIRPRAEPGHSLSRRQSPRGHPEVYAVFARQVCERQRRDRGFDLTESLREGRLGDAGGADRQRPNHAPGPERHQPRNDLVLQQISHLARHAGQHDDEAA